MVAAALIAVIVSALAGRGDQEQAGEGPTTSSGPAAGPAPVSVAAPELQAVDAACAATRAGLDASVEQVFTLIRVAQGATTPEALQALQPDVEQTAASLGGELERLRQAVITAEVPSEAAPQQEEMAASLGELIFAFAAFAEETQQAIAPADPAVLNDYGRSAGRSIGQLAALVSTFNRASSGAPSCFLEAPSFDQAPAPG